MLEGKSESLTSVYDDVLKSFGKEYSEKQITKNYKGNKITNNYYMTRPVFNNTAWPKFKPVAHFWAAYAELQAQHDGTYEFPCRVSHFREFLEFSESFRIAGLETKTKQSPSPVLADGESFRLPLNLGILPQPFDLAE